MQTESLMNLIGQEVERLNGLLKTSEDRATALARAIDERAWRRSKTLEEAVRLAIAMRNHAWLSGLRDGLPAPAMPGDESHPESERSRRAREIAVAIDALLDAIVAAGLASTSEPAGPTSASKAQEPPKGPQEAARATTEGIVRSLADAMPGTIPVAVGFAREPDDGMVDCDACDGCGWNEGGDTIRTTCHKCKGTGRVPPPTAEELAAIRAKVADLASGHSVMPGTVPAADYALGLAEVFPFLPKAAKGDHATRFTSTADAELRWRAAEAIVELNRRKKLANDRTLCSDPITPE